MMPQEDPFAQVRMKNIRNPEKLTQPEPQQEEEKSQEDPFESVRLKNIKPEESIYEKGLRHVSRTASRALETIIGMPGDFNDLANTVIQPLVDKLIPLNEKQKKLKEEVSFKLPTSENLKEKSNKLSKGYLQPKNEIEQMGDEATSTVASFLGPTKFRKALGLSLAGQAIKEGSKKLGLGETTSNAAKMGTIAMMSILNPGGIKKFWKNRYDQVEALTPKGIKVEGRFLKHKTQNLIDKLKEGTGAPSELKVLNQAENVLKKIDKNGKVELRDMIATKRSLNEIAGDPDVYHRAQHLFPKLQKAVDDVIKSHPDRNALKLYREANQAFSGYQQSKKLSRFITKNLPDKPLAKAIGGAIVEGYALGPEAVISTVAGAGAVAAGVQGIELIQRIMANPTTRKFYLEMFSKGAKENIPEMIKYYNHLERELEKSPMKKSQKHGKANIQ